MDMIAFICPSCGRKLGVDRRHASRDGTCPGCGAKVKIPRRTTAAAESLLAGAAQAGRPAQQVRVSPGAAGTRSQQRSWQQTESGSQGRGRKLLLIGGGAVVLVAVALALVFLLPAGGIGPDAIAGDPLKGIPADATAIGYVNLKELAEAGVIGTLLEAVEENEEDGEIGKLLAEANLDPARDLTSAMLICAGGQQAATIVVGAFDGYALRKLIKEKAKATEKDYKGYRLLCDGEGNAFRVVDDVLVIAGEEKTVHKIIDIMAGDLEPMGKDTPLLARAAGLRGETFWFTGDVQMPATPKDEGAEPGIEMMMPGLDPSKIDTATISGRITEQDCKLRAVLSCKDAESAEAMGDGLKQGINMVTAMAGMVTGGDVEAGEALGDLAEAIKISTKASSASIEMTISAEVGKKLAAMAWKLKGAPPEMGGPDEVETLLDNLDTWGEDLDIEEEGGAPPDDEGNNVDDEGNDADAEGTGIDAQGDDIDTQGAETNVEEE